MATVGPIGCGLSVFRFCGISGLLALLCGCARPGHVNPSPSALPQTAPGVFFVATNGNDAWSGHRPAANWRKTDGPFASLTGALAAVRRSKQQPPVPGTPPS